MHGVCPTPPTPSCLPLLYDVRLWSRGLQLLTHGSDFGTVGNPLLPWSEVVCDAFSRVVLLSAFILQQTLLIYCRRLTNSDCVGPVTFPLSMLNFTQLENFEIRSTLCNVTIPNGLFENLPKLTHLCVLPSNLDSILCLPLL